VIASGGEGYTTKAGTLKAGTLGGIATVQRDASGAEVVEDDA
jgi:uncharacterized protein YegP (UPF0339 family)